MLNAKSNPIWTQHGRTITLLDVQTYMAARLADVSNRIGYAWFSVRDLPEVSEEQKAEFSAIWKK
jgi:hypothetical protein